ncbi:methyl-CpG-binding domain protein 1b isoform X2 [Denticeps clupeoides]|uniref:methyl-CpG-binding domain protein 1b isoform X2 n=1 Tax=Denticeps clupeoides TaxID=299321 RepID=UPI0010A3553D|nr:methyl-CpG-binding domain protein 1-like isoform X2 [Denticeps clupeoides]
MNGGLQNDGGSVGDRPGRNDTEKGTVEPLVDKRVESAAGSTTGAEGCGKEVPGSSDSLIDSSNAPEEDPEPASGPDRAEKKADEPPEDWLEPLEDDYDDIDDTNDTKSWDLDLPSGDWHTNGNKEEMESLAGESERSGSVAGSERNYARRGGRGRCRRGRKSQMADEEWEEWPVLGKGWKRKEVLRRSGNSVGQSDTYYMSPSGARVRSRIELVKYLAGSLDLGTFDFKTGIFTTQLWQRRKRSKHPKMDWSPSTDHGLSDESSLPHDDRSYSPEGHHKLTSAQNHKNFEHLLSSSVRSGASTPGIHSNFTLLTGPQIHPLLAPLSPTPGPDQSVPVVHHAEAARQRPILPTVRQKAGTTIGCTCTKCGQVFTATNLEDNTVCRTCRATRLDNRNIVFRKWIPCGQCKACLITEDCKSCASCRNSQISQKPVRCRKRKCLCPIRKTRPSEAYALPPTSYTGLETRLPEMQSAANNVKCSDSEDVQAPLEDDCGDDSDDSYDGFDEDDFDFDFEGGIMKRKRRSCGKCEGCNMMRDCGTCDFCIDKPKFGGSNKKRQKCRLRQCQRQAMRHLLPFQSEILTQEGRIRPRHIFTYGRKRIAGRSQFRSQEKLDFEFSDAENEESVRTKGAARQPGELHSPARYTTSNSGRINMIKENMLSEKHSEAISATSLEAKNRLSNFGPIAGDVEKRLGLREEKKPQLTNVQPHNGEEEDSIPMITQIYSLADDEETMKGIDLDHDLLRLLESLRTAMLPVLWFALMARGPRLQLLQCSKLSTMADTVVHIEPSYTYQITVQGQPLIPTHPLYVDHPTHLASVAEVVTLLQDLEKYSVCQGLKSQATHHLNEPLVHERAATCDFLVPRSKERCAKCCNPTEK